MQVIWVVMVKLVLPKLNMSAAIQVGRGRKEHAISRWERFSNFNIGVRGS